ncbi:MAG: DUF503 domain-containing protein [Gemmataceae bacterium]
MRNAERGIKTDHSVLDSSFRTATSAFRIMVIGSLTVRLLVRESRTLKDKRQVVRGILTRLRGEFNVSAAEVDSLDDVKVATLGFAAVGFEVPAVQHVLQEITEAASANTPSRSSSDTKQASARKWCECGERQPSGCCSRETGTAA